MGKLRIEPKVKPPVDEEQYKFYKGILDEAAEASDKHRIFWDLEPGEKMSKVRKAFKYVAEKEGHNLRLRARRGSNTLSLTFADPNRSTISRMSAEESRSRIVNALKGAGEPLQKSDILEKTGISPSSWNIRIKELLKAKKVKRHGSGRQTAYTLISS